MKTDVREKYFTPEPSTKLTKEKLVAKVGSTILKFSKAIYNCPVSPSRIDLLEKLRIRDDPLTLSERFRTFDSEIRSISKPQRKFQFEGMQILNLPRLPYGKHLNYMEDGFLKRHFIDMDSRKEEFAELKSFNKQCHLQKKLERKNKKTTKFSIDYKNNLKNYLIFRSNGGDLRVMKEDDIVNSYEKEKNKYKIHVPPLDINLEKKVKSRLKKFMKKDKNKSEEKIEDILRIDHHSLKNNSTLH